MMVHPDEKNTRYQFENWHQQINTQDYFFPTVFSISFGHGEKSFSHGRAEVSATDKANMIAHAANHN